MLIPNSSTDMKERKMLSRCDVPRKILLFMGIGSGKCYTLLVFLVLSVTMIWYIIFIAIIGVENLSSLAMIGFIASPMFIDFMWLTLYSKRFKLEELFERTYYSSQSHYAPIIQLFCWFMLMLAYPALVIIFCFYEHKCHKFYSLTFTKNDLGSLGFWALALFGAYITQLVKTNFTCSITAMFCALCHRCRCKILKVKRELEAKDVPLVNILRSYQETLKIVILLEEVFSPIMLMLVIVNFLTMFTGLSILLFQQMSVFETIDIGVIFMLNLSSLIANSVFGAEIPIQAKDVNLKLYEINEEMSFRPNWASEKSAVEAILLRPEIVLSACNVLYFNRGFILAALGSLFTYGLVLVQFSKQGE